MYTNQRLYKYRGPDSSQDYNDRIEENYKDLVYLYNTVELLKGQIERGSSVAIKNLNALYRYLDEVEARLDALEAASNTLSMTSSTQLDNDRFDATAYAVQAADRCTYLSNDDGLTLPKVDAGSVSKIKFYNAAGLTEIIPSSVETVVVPITTTADGTNAIIETSQPYYAIQDKPGAVWERNVIVNTPDLTDGAQMYLFVRIPDELTATADTNCISFTPFPAYNIDILDISYSTDPNIMLSNSSAWTTFNEDQIYYQATGAAGNLMPGGWTDDEIIDSGPKVFYFDPKPITAIRFKLRQMNYLVKNSNYIYTYGMSKLDIRNDKFLDTGRAIIRFDAPNGDTISNITGITPYLWNIPEYMVTDVFDYRIIWETSYDSGSYTLTEVPFSQRVWVEVTLTKTTSGGTPQLTNLVLNYS